MHSWFVRPPTPIISCARPNPTGENELLDFVLDPPPTKPVANVVQRSAPGVGGWGGQCTCPDGQVYEVGDNYDSCRSLACVGGESGACKRRWHPTGSNTKVTCGTAGPFLGLPGRRVWPTHEAAFANSTAVSRRVSLRAGRRYWLGLTCTSPTLNADAAMPEVGRCALGARVHTDLVPRSTRLFEPAGRVHRRLAPRVHLKTGCGAVTDRELCCSALDRFNEPCVAAVTTFTNGKVCMPSQWAVRYASRTAPLSTAGQPIATVDADATAVAYEEIATCPASFDAPTATAGVSAARRRIRLPHMVACHTIRDRAHCSVSSDGRTQAIHLDQPCVAAQLQFLNGHLCETARYVKDLDPHSAASCTEFHTPFIQSPIGEGETLVHEVQTLTLHQAAPTRLAQLVTFTMIDCPANASAPADAGACAGTRDGTIQLTHNGKRSLPINLAAATPATIASAFLPLHDGLYSGVDATILHSTRSSVVWRLELTTPWESCTNQHLLPLLGSVNQAKVNTSVSLVRRASCLSGGVDVGIGAFGPASFATTNPAGVAPSSVFLPWDASEHLMEARLNKLLAADGSVVRVRISASMQAAWRMPVFGRPHSARTHPLTHVHPIFPAAYCPPCIPTL
jgi:hypothetical protein